MRFKPITVRSILIVFAILILFALALLPSTNISGVMASSLAFATPPAIAHIAIASGSGWATPKDMLKFGSIMSIISILVMYIIFTL